MNTGMRINKYLAACGVGSRRAVEEYIKAGRVCVNGVLEKDLARRILPDDIAEVDGKPVETAAKKIYIALYKPRGVVTTCKDQFGRKSVLDLLTGVTERVYPVGRLDFDTEGLLLLTNDGDFARRLTHPGFEIEKKYEAVLEKPILPGELKKLCEGVIIENKKTAPAKARFLSQDRKTVELIIHEGRNRQVRRMFEAVGVKVLRLKRTAVGKWTLGSLHPNEWKFIRI